MIITISLFTLVFVFDIVKVDCPHIDTTEPEVSEAVFRLRNRSALQYCQVL